MAYEWLQEHWHTVAVGEVQAGKSPWIAKVAHHIQKVMKRSVIILTNPRRDDRQQLTVNLDSYRPDDLLTYDMITATCQLMEQQVRQRKALLMLAHHSYLMVLDKILRKLAASDPAFRKPILIHDEADLLSIDSQDNILTENALRAVCENIYCRVSVTATPESIFFWDNIDHVERIPAREGYYGINQLQQINTTPKLPYDKKKRYCPEADRENLEKLLTEVTQRTIPSMTLLTVSELTVDHEATAKWIQKNYPDVVVIEFNGRNDGTTVWKNKKQKVDERPLASILWDLRESQHIAIVSGKKATRGMSFVAISPDGVRSRHLTDQYISVSNGRTFVDLNQILRILGVYTDQPTLKLYCTSEVWSAIRTIYQLREQLISAMISAKKPITHAQYAVLIAEIDAVMPTSRRKVDLARKLKGAPMQYKLNNSPTYSVFDLSTQKNGLRENVSEALTMMFANKERRLKYQLSMAQDQQVLDGVLRHKKIDPKMAYRTRHYDRWVKGHQPAPKNDEMLILWEFDDAKANRSYKNKKAVHGSPQIQVVDIRYNGAAKNRASIVGVKRT